MEDLPIGSEIVLKVVEAEKEQCNGCFFFCNSACEVWRKYPCGPLLES